MKKSPSPAPEISPEVQTTRRIFGVLLLLPTLLPVLSICTYDWKDISLLSSPCNPTPANAIGLVGAWFAFFGYTIFGLALWILPVCLLAYSGMLIYGKALRMHRRMLWMILFVIALCGLLQLRNAAFGGIMEDLNIRPNAGGAIGHWLITCFLEQLISPVGSMIIVIFTMVFSLIMLVGIRNIVQHVLLFSTHIDERAEERRVRREAEAAEANEQKLRENAERAKAEAAKAKAEEKERLLAQQRQELENDRKAAEQKRRAESVKSQIAAAAPEQPAKPAKAETPAGPLFAPREKEAPPPVRTGDYELPSTQLLDPIPHSEANAGDIEHTKQTIVDSLKQFRIDVEVTNVIQGPVVTQYELLPAPGVPVESINSRSKNLLMNLKATSMRIQAPIPGKGVVGIELPNEVKQAVTLRGLLEGERWKRNRMDIPMALGKDVGGADLVVDLAEMPHLLVAGSTGSGKSVCLNAMLVSLLMCRTPDELRLILVDPKHVEFALYEDLPHLLVPVITDPKKVAFGLRWAISEMEKRYKLLRRARVRSIKDYNSRPQQAELFPESMTGAEENNLPQTLPYIVIVIDEVADIMSTVGKEVENYIMRLTQKSRAVGIHLILATQRPTVDVITGTIKANILGRIALKVVQKNDSRTILDEQGAECLIGKGDMIVRDTKTNQLIRTQCAWVSSDEITRVTEHVRSQQPVIFDDAFLSRMETIKEADPDDELDQAAGIPAAPEPSAERSSGDDKDDLFTRGLEVLRDTKRATISSFQRRMGIGYNRAANLIEEMEQKGIVGPAQGSAPREILVDLDALLASSSADEFADADDLEMDEGTLPDGGEEQEV